MPLPGVGSSRGGAASGTARHGFTTSTQLICMLPLLCRGWTMENGNARTPGPSMLDVLYSVSTVYATLGQSGNLIAESTSRYILCFTVTKQVCSCGLVQWRVGIGGRKHATQSPADMPRF